MLGSASGKNKIYDIKGDVNGVGKGLSSFPGTQETVTMEEHGEEHKEDQQDGIAEEQGPLKKKLCMPVSNASSFLMKPVTL